MSSDGLDRQGSLAEFGALVGIEKQAVHKLRGKGVLSDEATLARWLLEYCDNLRRQAAGRGGDAQGELTRARIEESRENTRLKQLERLTKEGSLVEADQVAPVMEGWADQVRQDVTGCGGEIIEGIESRYSIELDSELVHGPLRDTLGRARERAQELGRAFMPGGGEARADPAGTDGGVG